MSERQSEYRESSEASWLRANWSTERLGDYNDRWIAVKQLANNTVDVIDHDASQEELIKRTKHRNPLYAYVLLGPLQ